MATIDRRFVPPQIPVVSLILMAMLSMGVVGVLAWTSANFDGAHPANIVYPGERGPSAAVFKRDFPGATLPLTVGHDGQQVYAISRQPMHLRAVVPALDRPRYRLQRIIPPVLAWALHPQGGGRGLVLAIFAVGFAGFWVGRPH